MQQNRQYVPRAMADLRRFDALLKSHTPFTFIRFSDGEMEVLRNRYLEIGGGYTIFKGKRLESNYPEYDRKKFNPTTDKAFREALLESAKKRGRNYFKGIPTAHNKMIEDRDFMVSLNGGISEYMTFSDLLINCNYGRFRRTIVPQFAKLSPLIVIANFRAKLSGELANAVHIPVGDNLFQAYESTLSDVLGRLREIQPGTVVLSSASSFSNIVGMKLYDLVPSATFIDVGTSLNDLMGLRSVTRAYHRLYFRRGLRDLAYTVRYMLTSEYRIRW